MALRLRNVIREVCSEKELQVMKGHFRPNHIHIVTNAPAYLPPARIARYRYSSTWQTNRMSWEPSSSGTRIMSHRRANKGLSRIHPNSHK